MTAHKGYWIRFVRRTLLVLVVAFLAYFPLALIGYAALGGALGGLAIIGGLMVVQWPLFAILMRQSPHNQKQVRDQRQAHDEGTDTKPVQFSLQWVFLLMTLFAIALGGVTFLQRLIHTTESDYARREIRAGRLDPENARAMLGDEVDSLKRELGQP